MALSIYVEAQYSCPFPTSCPITVTINLIYISAVRVSFGLNVPSGYPAKICLGSFKIYCKSSKYHAEFETSGNWKISSAAVTVLIFPGNTLLVKAPSRKPYCNEKERII